MLLLDIKKGETAQIIKINCSKSLILRLEKLGIKENSLVLVQDKNRGAILVESQLGIIAIDSQIAGNIEVKHE